MARKLANWVESFIAYTEGGPSPPLFRRWAGLAALAGVMERRVWSVGKWGELYPHMYSILVGPPGSGKSWVTSRVERLWRAVGDLHVAPAVFSFASLGDHLHKAKRQFINPATGSFLSYNALLIHIEDITAILPEYNPEMLGRLTRLWDGSMFDEGIRSRESFVVDKPNVNILGCATPGYFLNTFPATAWEQGFAARVLLIYSGEQAKTDMFEAPDEDDKKLYDALLSDLKSMLLLQGKMDFTRESIENFRAWIAGKEEWPRLPGHPKLRHYLTRRTTHAVKLAMLFSLSRGDSLEITAEDASVAIYLLGEIEGAFEEIFKGAVTAGDGRVLEEVFYEVLKHWTRHQKPLRAQVVVKYVASRVPGHTVAAVMKTLTAAGVLEEVFDQNGALAYKPGIKQQELE